MNPHIAAKVAANLNLHNLNPGFVNMPRINQAVPGNAMYPVVQPANPTGLPGTGMPSNQVNSYPGKSMGMTLDQAQTLAVSATKSVGYRHNLVAGQVNNFPGLSISGTAGILLGVTVMLVEQIATPQNAPRSFGCQINNYGIIRTTGFNFFNKQFMQHAFYFPVNQPLAGQDSVEVQYDNTGAPAQNVDLVFWYLWWRPV